MIELPRSAVKAVSLFIAKQDVRYYLNGMLVEVHKDFVKLVATDGTALAMYRVAGKSAAPAGISFIIPRDALERVLKEKEDTVYVDHGSTYKLKCGDVAVEFVPLDGRYPDVSRVIPAEDAEISPSTFNSDYLTPFVKAGKELKPRGYRGIRVLQHGDGTATIKLDDPDFHGVLMPMRDDIDDTVPAWATMALAEPEAQDKAA